MLSKKCGFKFRTIKHLSHTGIYYVIQRKTTLLEREYNFEVNNHENTKIYEEVYSFIAMFIACCY